MVPKKKKRFYPSVITLLVCCAVVAGVSVREGRELPYGIVRAVLFAACGPVYTVSSAEPEADVSESEPETGPVFERTITTAALSSDGLYISNLAKTEVDIPELLTMPEERNGKTVLILHTHGCESYTPTKKYNYKPDEDFRTTDTDFNVVRVGNEIEKQLVGHGITVIHDATLCDYPSFNDSYTNSRALAEKYLAENPDIGIILDVHRDSIAGENGEQIKTVGAENTSQLMFVVGTDAGGADHPLWRQNLSLALRLQRQIIAKYPKLMRPINLRRQGFNQQLSTGSLILEVGCDGNTLEEALNAARIFGDELGKYLSQ